jgi:hypothetical protein
MKPGRSAEFVSARRELAQLLRRLRAIRRQKLSHGEVIEQIGLALAQAGSISRYVRFTRTDDAGGWRCRSCWDGAERRPQDHDGAVSAAAEPRAVAAGW